MDSYKISKFLVENNIKEGDRILIALSGGVDSLSLAHILSHSKLDLICYAAHVNFNLRAEESDADQAFVEDWCLKNNIKLFINSFDTISYSKNNKISIEMAARELRYNWFYELMESNGIKYLAVGHNADDNAETILLNLTRGTGIKGLCGISPNNGRIIRPLLSYTRKEIERYAYYYKLEYRIDSTNAENDYTRNKVRNIVFPQLEKINPSVIKTINRDAKYLNIANSILEGICRDIKCKICKYYKKEYLQMSINIHDLCSISDWKYFLFYILNEYGFNSAQVEDISDYIIDDYCGVKRFNSDNFILIVERGELKLYDNKVLLTPSPVTINIFNTEFDIIFGDITLSFKIIDNNVHLYSNILINKEANIQYLNADNLMYPLVCRTMANGDKFIPLGMKKNKKLSDFFTDIKIDNLFKMRCPVITNPANEIICLPGLRIDDRYRVTDKTYKVLVITVITS